MKTRILIFVMVSLLCVAGCAATGYQGVKTEGYPETKQAFDLTIGWKKSVTDTGMTIKGYARNNRYFIVQGLELRVALVAANGTEKASEPFFFIPLELHENEAAPFSVTLKTRPKAGDRLRFSTRYLAVDDPESSNTWVNSFEVPAVN